MSPTYRECKTLEEKQEALNAKHKRRKRMKRTGILVTIAADVKKHKHFERQADYFRKEGAQERMLKNFRRINQK